MSSEPTELYSGATGLPLYRDPGGELAQLRRQQRQLSLEDATPLARDAAQAYREVMGDRRQRERTTDSAAQGRGNTSSRSAHAARDDPRQQP